MVTQSGHVSERRRIEIEKLKIEPFLSLTIISKLFSQWNL